MKHILLNGTLIWEALQEEAESEFDALWEILKSPTVQGYITQDDLDNLYYRIATEQDFELAFAMVSYVQQVLTIYYPGHSHTLDVAIAQNFQPELSQVKFSSDVPFVSVKGFLERHSLNKLLEESVPTTYARGWQRKGQQSDFDPLLLVPIALTLLLQNTPLFQTFLPGDPNKTEGNGAHDPNHLFKRPDRTTIYGSAIQQSRRGWGESTSEPLLVEQMAQLEDLEVLGDAVNMAGDRSNAFPDLIPPHAFTLAWYQLDLNSSASQVVTQQRANLNSDSLSREFVPAETSTALPNRTNFAVRSLSSPRPLSISIVRSGENYSIPLPPQNSDRPESEATSDNRRDPGNVPKPSMGQPFPVIIIPRPSPSGENSAAPPVQESIPYLEDSPEDFYTIPDEIRLAPEESDTIPGEVYAAPEVIYIAPEEFYAEDENLPFLDNFLEIILADVDDGGLYIGIVIWTIGSLMSHSYTSEHDGNIVSSNELNLINTDVPFISESDTDLFLTDKPLTDESLEDESLEDPSQDKLLHGGRWYGVMPQPLSQGSIDDASDVTHTFDELLKGGQHASDPTIPGTTISSDVIPTSVLVNHVLNADFGVMFPNEITPLELHDAYSGNAIDFHGNHLHSTASLHNLLEIDVSIGVSSPL